MRVFNRAIKAKTLGKVTVAGAKRHMGKGIWEEDMRGNGTVVRTQEQGHKSMGIGART